uniref:CCHC-type domain-containing protein n=1 Tax=Anopheles epiroticus TaxID=199890 RepID=A0A182PU27_9DIPT
MELEKLEQTCNFGDYLDKALRNQFVFGLQNRAIQSRLLEVRDLKLAKAKDIAFSMEMSNRGADEIQGSCPAYPVQHIIATGKKKNKPTINQRKTACYRCGNENHLANKCRYLNTICNHCKTMRHLDKGINLDLNKFITAKEEVSYCEMDSLILEKVLDKYLKVFEPGIGKIEGLQAKSTLRKDTKPVFFKARSVAFAVRDA